MGQALVNAQQVNLNPERGYCVKCSTAQGFWLQCIVGIVPHLLKHLNISNDLVKKSCVMNEFETVVLLVFVLSLKRQFRRGGVCQHRQPKVPSDVVPRAFIGRADGFLGCEVPIG